jgi:hypothetical protein
MKILMIFQKGLRTITVILAVNVMSCSQKPGNHVTKVINLNLAKSISKVDGFGVNITPAQWNNGKLKPVIDMLVDDLGATLFRFDCTGQADWLDPAKRQSNGTWPESYLDSVYNSRVFSDAWETFRYLNHKGIQPFFNVSGCIYPAMGRSNDTHHLEDFEGYAEMVVTMLHWARNQEHLNFNLLAPFNENNYGYPEGALIDATEMVDVVHAIIRKLKYYKLNDIQLVLMDATYPDLNTLALHLADNSLAMSGKVKAFSVHTYVNGDPCDLQSLCRSKSDFALFTGMIRDSPFKDQSSWLSEYGDLDETGEIEYQVAWLSTLRLMKRLSDGFNAALVWDAFDNYHEHNAVWTHYGLLKTDTVNWTYTPKKRYFAAKQVYRFIKTGWKMAEIITPQPIDCHIRILAFVSPDGDDYTMVIMNGIESDVDLSININDLDNAALSKTFHHFVTDKTDNCSRKKDPSINNSTIRVLLPEHSISTVTTLDK